MMMINFKIDTTLQKGQISEAWEPAHTAMPCWMSGSNKQRITYTAFL